MRLFRPLTSFLPSRPFGPHPRLFPAFLHPGCRRFPPLPSRFFIDSNLFHLPPVRSSQHHSGLVPIPLGDIRPCCLHRPSLRRLLSVARIVTPSTLPHAAMSAPAPSTMSPQAARPLVRFCSSRATIFRHLRLPSLSLAALPRLSSLTISCPPVPTCSCRLCLCLPPVPAACCLLPPAPVPACAFLSVPAAAPALAPSCARRPRSWREAL